MPRSSAPNLDAEDLDALYELAREIDRQSTGPYWQMSVTATRNDQSFLTKSAYIDSCWNHADHYSSDATRYYTKCRCPECIHGFTREDVAREWDEWDESTAEGYEALKSGPWHAIQVLLDEWAARQYHLS